VFVAVQGNSGSKILKTAAIPGSSPFAIEACVVKMRVPIFVFAINQSIGMYRIRWFLAVLRSLFNSSLSYTFSCQSSPPTILSSSLTSSSHLFLGLSLGLVVSRCIYNTLLGILFSSILCTCPNQRNLCSLTVSVIVGFFNICINSLSR